MAVQWHTLGSKTKDKAQSEKNCSRLQLLAYLNLWDVQGQTERKKLLSWAKAYLL